MPYKHAHFYVGAVLLVILGGFWASYFAPIRSVPLAFHVHAISASAWLLLLIAQSWAIQHRHNGFHRMMGKASFALFPFLIVGFVMIINVSATRYAAAESDFIMALGPAFGMGMLVAIAAYLILYYRALRDRRTVKLHAGYMLATPLILFESPFSRLMDQFFPWLNFIRSEGPFAVIESIAVSNAIAFAIALVLYLRHRAHGAPWLVAMAFIAIQTVVMWYAGRVPALGELFRVYATVPPALTIACGALIAAAVGWAGWKNGARPKVTSTAAEPA